MSIHYSISIRITVLWCSIVSSCDVLL